MENDARKQSENNSLDSCDLLTDWLLKYKLENISYLSSPSTINTSISKTSRKGCIFDSRDIIRPTVQLFKNIKLKAKKRNDSPSPQRKQKQSTNLSPTKEANRIFTHRASCDTLLNAYKRIYTYAKVKHDKVSRDKIESAVVLFRQRELDKETSARHAPEKNAKRKKLSIKESNITAQKPGTRLKSITPVTEEKKQIKRKIKKNIEKDSLDRPTREKDRCSEIEECKKCEECLVEKNDKKSKVKNKLELEKTVIGRFDREDDKLISQKVKVELKDENNKKEIEKEKNGTKGIKILKKQNSQHSQVGMSNRCKERADLIDSLKSKKSSPQLTMTKTMHTASRLGSTDYIIIRPALIGDNNEVMDEIQSRKKDKPNNGSIDDLLQEYRIKYRNMIRMK